MPLDITGDRVALPEIQVLAPVPTPEQVALSDGTDGYFMHTDYGIALSRVTRQTSSDLPNWKVVQVNMSLLSRAGSRLGTIAWGQVDGQTCFVGETGNECLTVEWGDIERFEAAVQFLEGDSPLPLTNVLELPRGFGWSVAVSFLLPEDIGEATLVFGDNRIPLDVRGMIGDAPAWQYRELYPQLQPNTEVFKFGTKTVVLRAIKQEDFHGDITLVFEATQGVGETSDFRPVVSVDASRITESGLLVDGLSVGTSINSSFTPSVASVTALPIQPGGKQTFEITLPRVVGDDFIRWEFGEDRPALVLASIVVSDAMSDAPSQATPAALVHFQRYADEEKFWLPDLSVESITWEIKDRSLVDSVQVTAVIRNLSKTDAGPTRPHYLVGERRLGFLKDLAVEAGVTYIANFSFTVLFTEIDVTVAVDVGSDAMTLIDTGVGATTVGVGVTVAACWANTQPVAASRTTAGTQANNFRCNKINPVRVEPLGYHTQLIDAFGTKSRRPQKAF